MDVISYSKASKAYAAATLGRTTREVPSGLGYTPPFNVYSDKTGIITDFDITKYRPVGKRYFVSSSGSDSNDGLTIGTAFSSVTKALSMSDVVEIYVQFGLYLRTKFAGTPIAKNISIIAYGGPVTLSMHDALTWAVSAGYTSTYEATRSTVGNVWDAKATDASGDYAQLTKQTSIANVDANPGSWYSDGTKVYVRTSDSRVPDSNIRVFLSASSAVVNGGVTVYFEGISFEGGTEPLRTTATTSSAIPTVYAKDCKFKYATTGNGTTIQGSKTFFVNCEAARNYLDGFNYHLYNTVNCTSVEIDCIGRNNGYSGVTNNNGSTTHDGNTAVRINGTYYGNYGPNVVDVNSSKSWNVGCIAYSSAAAEANFYIDGQMWLDSCESYGSVRDLETSVSGSVMNVRNTKTKLVFQLAGGTSLLPY